MGYTTPTTRATLDVVTAGDWNTDIVDNIAWIGEDKPMCRLTKATTQSITSGSYTACTFDTETFDTATMHDTGSNTSRITFATAGIYLIGGDIQYAAATGSNYSLQARLQIDGTTYIANSSSYAVVGGQPMAACVTQLYQVTANQYCELIAHHDQGTSVLVAAKFWATWIAAS